MMTVYHLHHNQNGSRIRFGAEIHACTGGAFEQEAHRVMAMAVTA